MITGAKVNSAFKVGQQVDLKLNHGRSLAGTYVRGKITSITPDGKHVGFSGKYLDNGLPYSTQRVSVRRVHEIYQPIIPEPNYTQSNGKVQVFGFRVGINEQHPEWNKWDQNTRDGVINLADSAGWLIDENGVFKGSKNG